jgi:hypothetical protein
MSWRKYNQGQHNYDETCNNQMDYCGVCDGKYLYVDRNEGRNACYAFFQRICLASYDLHKIQDFNES